MSLRPRGVGLMIDLELRQRVRSVRWYIALGIWFLLLTGMSVLIGLASMWLGTGSVFGDDLRLAGAIVFSASVLLLIFAMLLVIPAMSSAAINGDRADGTLATLQATLLSPLEIVVGKVLAGWITGLAFLVAALPSVVPAALLAGASPFYVARVIAMIAALTLCITAIGVGLSSLTNRPLGSVVLSYLVVLGTTTILPIVFACAAPFVVWKHEVTVYETEYTSGSMDAGRCVKTQEVRDVVRTDLLMPLLWLNPFVIVADTAPQIPIGQDDIGPGDIDALRGISTLVRYLAHPTHPSHFVDCWDTEAEGYPKDLEQPWTLPVWPMGLGAHALVAAGAVAVATYRIKAPVRRLGTGMRIA